MKVFVINLDRRQDRLQAIHEQLSKLGIEYERISAVDGSTLAHDVNNVDTNTFRLNQRRSPGSGEIGCAESHKKIWEKMLREDIDYALILEDDAELTSGIREFLLSDKSRTFDFLNLSSKWMYSADQEKLSFLCGKGISDRPFFFQIKQRKLWSTIEWNRNWKKVYKRFFWRIFKIHRVSQASFFAVECDPAPMSSSGYILSNKGASSLLAFSSPIKVPVDKTWHFASGNLVQGFSVPEFAKQGDAVSDIANDRSKQKNLTNLERIKRVFFKTRRLSRVWDTIKMYTFRFF